MAKVLQANMHRSRVADALLEQMRLERGIDVLLLSEPYRARESPTWFVDTLGTAAIWIPDPSRFRVQRHGAGAGYVWVSGEGLTLLSVYLSPNDRIAEFRDKIGALEDTIQELEGGCVVGGDLNAKAVEWGMPRPDTRGRHIVEMAARLNLVVLNRGTSTTFRRFGYRETIVDVTMASEDVAPRIDDWKVIEDYTGSDHQYVAFQIAGRQRWSRVPLSSGGWNIKTLHQEKFREALQRKLDDIPRPTEEPRTRLSVERLVGAAMSAIHGACEASMSRGRPRSARRPAYWWSSDIADLRRDCLRLRRRAQRAGRTPDGDTLWQTYRAKRRELRHNIRTSQRRCWESLREEVNRDPWGLGYKIVRRRIGAQNGPAILPEDEASAIVDALFPVHPARARRTAEPRVDEIPPFTERELLEAARSFRNRKAPGPDGIPAEVVKLAVQLFPRPMLGVLNACLGSGVWPTRWKVQRLALINKGKGQLSGPSAYRPICMLDTAGKLLEKMIRPRLLTAYGAAGDLSDRQYGFRRGRSTVDALRRVLEAAENAESGNRHSWRVVVVATLDVRNAFNSASWAGILAALENTFQVPDYLLRLVEDYFDNRVLLYDTVEGRRRRSVSAGVAQGSILGPDLWNAFYDAILRIGFPSEAFLVGYADDIAAVVTARDTELAQYGLNQVMRRVQGWMDGAGLRLATEKTEIVVLSRQRIPTEIPFRVGVHTILAKAAVRYLGVQLDSRRTFWCHIRQAADRAASVASSLARLMANVGGPRSSRRRLLMTAAQAIMLYAAEVWAPAFRFDKYRRRMAAVQRRCALRVVSGYRTVAEPTVLVIAGMMPIDLLARERMRVYEARQAGGDGAEARRAARQDALHCWQQRWQEETRGRWTARLIPSLADWVGRPHGEVDYYSTQLLSGHGYFRAYLFGVGRAASPLCGYGCREERDSAEHTFFVCSRWAEARDLLQQDVGPVTPDNIVGVMLRSLQHWSAVVGYARRLLLEKKSEESRWNPATPT